MNIPFHPINDCSYRAVISGDIILCTLICFNFTMQNTVHGSIFFLLKKYIDHSFGLGAWDDILDRSKTAHDNFDITKAYPLEEIGAIISTVSEMTGKSANDLKEAFGEYLVPDLFNLYKSYLKPDWRTLDVIEHTEKVMHGAVRKLNSAADPPILNVSRVNEKKLIVDYFSRRKMGSLALGIIKGIARYYNEQNDIKLSLTTDPDEERVQIVIEKV